MGGSALKAHNLPWSIGRDAGPRWLASERRLTIVEQVFKLVLRGTVDLVGLDLWGNADSHSGVRQTGSSSPRRGVGFQPAVVGRGRSERSSTRSRSPTPSGVPCAYLGEVTSLSPGLPPQRLPWVTVRKIRRVPCKGSFPHPVIFTRWTTMIDGLRKQSLQDRGQLWGTSTRGSAAHQPRAERSIPCGELFGRERFWKHAGRLWEASL